MRPESIQFILNLILDESLPESIQKTKADVIKRWPLLSDAAHDFIAHVLVHEDVLEQAILASEQEKAQKTQAQETIKVPAGPITLKDAANDPAISEKLRARLERNKQ